MEKQKTQPQAPMLVPAAPLPSADLIIYRLDQTDERFKTFDEKMDKRFEGLGRKLDNNLATKEELHGVDIRLETVEHNISRVVWLVVSAVIVTVLVNIGFRATK